MRVQPHLPSSPFTAMVMASDGSAWCACSAANSPAPPEPRMRMSVFSRFKASPLRTQRTRSQYSYSILLGGFLCDLRVLSGKALRFRLFYSERGERRGALRARGLVHFGVKAAAVAVHGDQQRAEALHPELPQRLGIEVVQVDVLDLLDPGRFQRGRAADHREIDAAQVPERRRRAFAQAALADDDARAVFLH